MTPFEKGFFKRAQEMGLQKLADTPFYDKAKREIHAKPWRILGNLPLKVSPDYHTSMSKLHVHEAWQDGYGGKRLSEVELKKHRDNAAATYAKALVDFGKKNPDAKVYDFGQEAHLSFKDPVHAKIMADTLVNGSGSTYVIKSKFVKGLARRCDS